MEAAAINRMFNLQDVISKRSTEKADASQNNFENMIQEASKKFETKDEVKTKEPEKVESSKEKNEVKEQENVEKKDETQKEESTIDKEETKVENKKTEDEDITDVSKKVVVGEFSLNKTDSIELKDVLNNIGNEKITESIEKGTIDNIIKDVNELMTTEDIGNKENTESISIEDLVNQIAEETGITEDEKESLTEALYKHYFEEDEEELEVQADVDHEVSDSDRIQTIQDNKIEGLESGEKVFEVGPQMVETENMTSNSNQMGSRNRGSETEDNSGKIEVVNLKKNKTELKTEAKIEESLTYTEATNNFEEKLTEVKSEIVNKNQNIENPEEVIKQITEKAKFILTDDKSEVVIKLKPDHLGKVSLKISIENGNISAKFLAESERVREMLESNFNSLKESLNKQGLNIQNLSVSVGNSNKERNFEQETSIMSRRINARRVVNLGINNDDNIEDVEMLGMLRNNYYWPNSTVSYTA